MPEISIIVPVYNSESTLQQCISSVLKQQYDKFELLLIDNNSTDDSLNICREYERLDQRVHCYVCAEQGVSSARNMGIEYSTGRFLFFLDSDDLIDLGFLERVYSCAIDNSADLVIPRVVQFASRRGLKGLAKKDKSTKEVEVLERGQIPFSFAKLLPTYRYFPVFKLYRAEIIKQYKLRFDPLISIGEDLFFNVAYLGHCECCVTVEDARYFYFYSPSNFSNLARKYRPEMLSLKKTICTSINDYLYKNGVFDDFRDEYYLYCLNELYSCVINVLQTEHIDKRAGLSLILSDSLFAEVVKYRFTMHIPLKKRIFKMLMSLSGFTTVKLLVMRVVFLFKLA